MDAIEIRAAAAVEYESVAGLRWRWELEHREVPDMPREQFVDAFAIWAREHAESHRCTVAVRDGTVVGMAWLALVPRVPTPGSLVRVGGDLQSVYLVPEERAGGLGGRLVRAVLDQARRLGLSPVTVHSSTRAVPVYARNGFEHSPELLIAEPGGPV